jgi:hypothetical protein
MHTAGAGRPADAPPPPGGFGGTPTDCAGQLTARAMTYIGSIDLRRIWIADEEKGLVFAYSMFRHPMEKKSIEILNKDGSIPAADELQPVRSQAAHLQDLRRQDPRIRRWACAPTLLEERVEPVLK